MDKDAEKILRASGWHENRTVDITPIMSHGEKLGIVFPEHIQTFLKNYGLLYIQFTTKDGRHEEFNFDPCFATSTTLNRDYFQDSIQEPYDGILKGEQIYPIGSCFRDNMITVACNTGKCFAYTDSCFMKLGDSFEEMIECLLELRMPIFYDD